jgi:hypothetical protein
MAGVVLILALGAGIYANIKLGGNYDTDQAGKMAAMKEVEEKIGQFDSEALKEACSIPVYELKDGEHTFTCKVTEDTLKGGKKLRKSKTKKSKKSFRKSRKMRK